MATNVEAQITGSVWKIEKAAGDAVSEGEVIMILESMKMEIPVEAPRAGRVGEFGGAQGARSLDVAFDDELRHGRLLVGGWRQEVASRSSIGVHRVRRRVLVSLGRPARHTDQHTAR